MDGWKYIVYSFKSFSSNTHICHVNMTNSQLFFWGGWGGIEVELFVSDSKD